MISHFLTALLAAGAAAAPYSPSVARFEEVYPRQSNSSGGSGNSFAGTNNYFLHGLSTDDQTNYINTISGWGAKVVRLWVTGLGGCVKGSNTNNINDLESTLGQYDSSVLDALDDVLKLLSDKGIKAIISPHDANDLNGANGDDVYGKTYGSSDGFYNSGDAAQAYDNRLKYILSYQSKNFNKPWGQLSEAIMAFDIQNEPMIGSTDILSNNDPNGWLCGRATNMKQYLSGVHVATGGIGGSDYCCDHEFNTLQAALDCDDIDIISIHGYMSNADQWAYFIPGNTVGKTSKNVMVEEWGVSGDGEFGDQVAVFNNAGVPWTYWQVTPQDQSNCSGDCCSGWDNFEIGLQDTSKGDVASAISAANAATATQDWSGYF